MTSPDPRRRVDALLPLARGMSQRAVAVEVGVAAGTVSRWLKDRMFVLEVARIRAVAAQLPFDAEAVMRAVEEAGVRLAPPGPQVGADGSVNVTVEIPAGATARQRERLMARAVARGLRAVREAES
ncbi:helix-turn-helix domain-containing protein [Streptomyces fagopyri]|uniref:helix-turn-helix domain-containing protein n=1 Tax=Streptomyces fagopyri TaxID=2662397 RepID=UPI00371B8690